jgi:hypothetical protein
MFSINETRENRVELLKKLLDVDHCVALVIAFLDFEWTIRRCVMALGRSRTSVIRDKFSGKRPLDFYCKDETTEQDMQEEKIRIYHPVSGLDKYNKIWTMEVLPLRKISLFDLLKSRVKIRTIEGFDQNKFNKLKQIGNTDEFLKHVYRRFRHALVHGIRSDVEKETAKFVFNFIVACSGALCAYAEEQGKPVYGKKIVRRKTL